MGSGNRNTKKTNMTTTLFHDLGHDNSMYVGEIRTNGEIPQVILEGYNSSATIGRINTLGISNNEIDANSIAYNPYVVGLIVAIVSGLVLAKIAELVPSPFGKKILPKNEPTSAIRVESGALLDIENVGFDLSGNSEALKIQEGSRVNAKNIKIIKNK